MAAVLASLQVGRPRLLPYRDQDVLTAIFKVAVSGPLRLGPLGLEGDQQADLRNHGGPDKAVCVYGLERYDYWSQRLGRTFAAADFGENFTTRGLLEDEVCIGDIYRVGTALVQVSQPRGPCYKLAARHGLRELPAWLEETGFTGFYLRCLQEGLVQSGEAITLVERPGHGVTVAEANRVMFRDRHDRAGLERVLAVPELSEAWRHSLSKRLA